MGACKPNEGHRFLLLWQRSARLMEAEIKWRGHGAPLQSHLTGAISYNRQRIGSNSTQQSTCWFMQMGLIRNDAALTEAGVVMPCQFELVLSSNDGEVRGRYTTS